MYLSKIELFGFKSFAYKVKITFDKGLTAIVGPNGCGKTNVVDAIRWVLGEQKSSLLRSMKMENIIFNGSKNLKPLSLTEVSITIENTRNVLPIEYTEVTVTRRLYRSGESDFLLNQVPCRLRDILDLFTDTGMGSDAYSVIELKMIEEIISNKSEERLKLFEEAAGITRYKQRRKQTFKLLETTSQDMRRVDDVMAEVEKKVKSLRLQVRKAEKLRELQQEIKRIDLALSWLTMEELRQKLQPLERRIRDEELISLELTAKIATSESTIQESELRLLEEEKALSENQKKLNERNQQLHSLEKQLLQHEEQQRNSSKELLRTSSIIREKEQKIQEQELLTNSLLQRLDPLEAACSQLETAFQALATEHDQLNTTLRKQREELGRERRESGEHQKAATQLALKKQGIEAKKEHLSTSLERLEQKKLSIQKKLEASHPLEAELLEEIEQKKALLGEAKKRQTLLQEEHENVSGQIEEKKERLLLCRAQRDKLHNQILLANSILDNFEGMPEGIALLEKEKKGNRKLGCISDLLQLEGSYKKALNAALGECMNYYVCQSLDEASQSIATLKRANKGKIHFLILDLVPRAPRGERVTISGTEKTLEVIRYPEELHDAITLMLANSYIVPDLAMAETLARHHPGSSFVTREGESFSAEGVLFGGSSSNTEGLRLGKKAERESLQQEFSGQEERIRQEEAALQQLRNKLLTIKTAEQRRHVEQLALELGNLEKKFARLDAEKSGMQQDMAQTEKERELTLRQHQASEEELHALQPEISRSESEGALLMKKIRKLQESLSALETRHHELGREVQARQSRYKDSLLDLEKLRLGISASREERLRLLEELKKLHTERDEAETNKKLAIERAAKLKEELEALLILAATEQNDLNEKESRYREHQAHHHESQSAVRELRRKAEVTQQLLKALGLEQSQAEQSLDHLFISVQIKHSVDLATTPPPEIEPSFERKASAEKLELLVEQRRQFGSVNELALEEYEAEKERLDFLTEQKADLLGAETQLRSTIEEINKTAQEKFQETYHQVRKNFITIFHELFDPEDEVDLLVHTDEDPLEAHIEIIAKPRGKKPLSIEQLSGGEKALTALSLLFAIYLVKPSPFCILDEVDAPLDDGNVERFIKLLKKFENNTQFIIVTHNKKTMASCQTLYGVTMEEEGVSKLIPVRLEKTRI